MIFAFVFENIFSFMSNTKDINIYVGIALAGLKYLTKNNIMNDI
jgi:hypothetical protein